MATFVFKVFTLAIRTASKPVASRFQAYVLDHPTLRPRVLKFAQGIHSFEFAMNRIAEGKALSGSQRFLAKLDDERALDLAGKFVSEGFVLAVGVGVLYWDFRRGAAKDTAKSEKDAVYKAAVEDRFQKQEQTQRHISKQLESLVQAVKQQQDAMSDMMSEATAQREKKSTSWFHLF